MKKSIFLFVFISSILISFAQTTLTQAVDFTVTDTKGTQHNLFDYLNAGKFVCVDFFYKDCPACVTTAPYYQGAFENFGCNTGNVIFIALSSQDNDATLITYADEHSYKYPMVNSTFGGPIFSTYGVSATPTYILIAPNKTIVEQDMWPISSAQDFITKITNRGGTAKTCPTGVEENQKPIITSYPNPTNNVLNVYAPAFNRMQFEVVDILGKVVSTSDLNSNDGLFVLNLSHLNNGIYFVRYMSNSEIIGINKVIKK